jgi:hypothetical protein
MNVKPMLQSQYRASLAMLLAAIEKSPDTLWTSDAYANPCWHIAYHTLYYADLYLHQTEADFTPWDKHRQDYQRLTPRPPDSAPLIPYSRAEALEYGRRLDAGVAAALARLDLTAPECGFSWYQMSKFEHQLVSLRHIHHHTGQLVDRLRHSTGRGSPWTKAVPV